jgi:hypothetical protein
MIKYLEVINICLVRCAITVVSSFAHRFFLQCKGTLFVAKIAHFSKTKILTNKKPNLIKAKITLKNLKNSVR